MTVLSVALRAALVGSIVMLVVACAPMSASAVEQTIEACGDETGSLFDWGFQNPYDPPDPSQHWELSINCPSIVLQSVAADSDHWGSQYSTPSSWDWGRVTFDRVSFDLRGSNGSDGGRVQGVRICADGYVCTSLITPPGMDEHNFVHHDLSLADGTLPAGARYFSISGGCAAPAPWTPENCAPGRELEVKNLRMTFDDSIAPSLIRHDEDPTGMSAAPVLRVGEWNGLVERSLFFESTDAESGVNLLKYRLNGTRWHSESCLGEGSSKMVRLCGPFAQIEESMPVASAYGARPGENTLEVVAVDAAGNESPEAIVNYKLDLFRPIVTNLRAATAVSGIWQESRAVDLEWVNVPDSQIPEAVSPVVSASAGAYVGSKPNPVASKSRSNLPGVDALRGLTLPADGVYRVVFSVRDSGDNLSYPQTIEVGVDGSTPAAPEIEALEPLGSQYLQAGAHVKWIPPSPSISGVCGYAVKFDRNPISDPGTFKSAGPAQDSAPIPAGLPHGANYVHVRAISCAGVAGEIAHKMIEVDSAAPEITLNDPPSGGWYGHSDPLTAKVTLEEGVEMAVAVDGSPPSWKQTAAVDVPLTGGEHTVVVYAKDSFGNVATRAVNVRFDAGPPTAVFEPFDPTRPTSVRGIASDPDSGVRSTELQYRDERGGDWHSFGRSFHPEAARTTTFGEVFPDLLLDHGVYELRVVVTDASGRMSEARSRADGSPVKITVPLRAPVVVSAGFRIAKSKSNCGKTKRSCAGKNSTSLASSRLVKFGSTTSVSGRVTDASGLPVGGAPLRIYEIVGAGPRALASETYTGADGGFRVTLRPGASRRIIVRFPGSETLAPGEAEVKLLVSGKVSLIAPRRARAEVSIPIRGRISTPGLNFPSGGRVVLQYELRGRFRQIPFDGVLDDMVVAADGTYTARLRFKKTGSATRYRIRAVVPSPQRDWPFERAVSRVRTVVVR